MWRGRKKFGVVTPLFLLAGIMFTFWVNSVPVCAEEIVQDTEITQETPETGEWVLQNGRWWYRHADGGYTTNGWELIGGKWYLFDSAGWMLTGWQQVGGKWYYLGDAGDGSMKTGWYTVNGVWYYSYDTGVMAADAWVGSYYVDASGAWVPNIRYVQSWVWVAQDGKWWYRHADGSYTANGWELIEGKWYLFDSEGWMLTGWQQVGGKWYYLGTPAGGSTGWHHLGGGAGSGYMRTGWYTVNGIWYYSYEDGAMAADTWIGNYYVDASGAWVQTR